MLRSFLAFAAVILLAAPASAESLSLPPGPAQGGGSDSIYTADGTRCEQSLNTNGPMLDIGVGSNMGMDGYKFDKEDSADILVYARVVIPLGRKPDRLDCKRLYDLEIERLKMQIEMMKMGM